MEIASSNTDEERARGWLQDDIRQQLRDLAANLLRVIRGAGRPSDIPPQIFRLSKTLEKYYPENQICYWPLNYSEMLSIRRERQKDGLATDDLSRNEEYHVSQHYAEERMIRGALQIAASRLIGQSIQEAAGKNELLTGANAWNDAIKAETRALNARPKGEAYAEALALTMKGSQGKKQSPPGTNKAQTPKKTPKLKFENGIE